MRGSPGANPDLDASASVNIRLFSILTHTDGSEEETVHFDYGMQTGRDPIFGVLLPDPTNDALGALSRFDEPDGSFGFRLLPVIKDFSFGSVRPGESLEFGYDYFAQASTGFGETGVFAAIGDPFNLSTDGGSFEFHVADAPAPSQVPEPASVTMVGIGLVVLRIFAHRRRRPIHNSVYAG